MRYIALMRLMRNLCPPSPLTPADFNGLRAACRFCDGKVMMWRNLDDKKLNPADCSCVRCRQRYVVHIPDMVEFERIQLAQHKRAWCLDRQQR